MNAKSVSAGGPVVYANQGTGNNEKDAYLLQTIRSKLNHCVHGIRCTAVRLQGTIYSPGRQFEQFQIKKASKTSNEELLLGEVERIVVESWVKCENGAACIHIPLLESN